MTDERPQHIVVTIIDTPPRPRIEHRHRWAWRVDGVQECYDCGAVRR